MTLNNFPSYLPLPQAPIIALAEQILKIKSSLAGLTEEEIAVVEGKPIGVRS